MGVLRPCPRYRSLPRMQAHKANAFPDHVSNRSRSLAIGAALDPATAALAEDFTPRNRVALGAQGVGSQCKCFPGWAAGDCTNDAAAKAVRRSGFGYRFRDTNPSTLATTGAGGAS